MLSYREHTTRLKSLAISYCTASDQLGIISEATCPDDWVLRIDIYIYYRRKVDVDPHELALTSYLSPIGFDKLHIPSDAESLATWVAWGILESHEEPPFSIKGYQKRNAAGRLQTLGQLSLISEETFLE